MSEQKYYITPSGNEITIREGKAVEQLPLKEPQKIAIEGDIHTVSAFLSKRKEGHSLQAVDPNKAIITVDKTARRIVMELEPENHYGTRITAKLEQSDELKSFGINTEKIYSRAELTKLVKFNRFYFENKDTHAAVLLGVQKISFKSESEIKQEQDSKGNKANSFETRLYHTDGFVDKFTLFMPLFKGFPAAKIQVEICYEQRHEGISFWLESPELKEVVDGQIDKIFDDELEDCTDFVIINK